MVMAILAPFMGGLAHSGLMMIFTCDSTALVSSLLLVNRVIAPTRSPEVEQECRMLNC